MQSHFNRSTKLYLLSLLRAFVLMTALLAIPLAYAAYLEEANLAYKAGQYSKALSLVEKHLATQPEDVQGRFLRGVILFNLNRLTDAQAVFSKLTEDYPDLPGPYNNLAVIYAQQKQYDKAREALERAIRTNPTYATAYENLGDIYSHLASQAYNKALSLDTSNVSAQTKLTMINELFGGSGKSAAANPSAAMPAPATVASAKSKPSEPYASHKPVDFTTAAEAGSAPAAPKLATSEAEIVATIDAWLAAWSRKDVKAYLAHYAPDFQPSGGRSREEWENERIQRVSKPGKIKVSRGRPMIWLDGADRAIVRFRQYYKSTNLNVSSTKTLILKRQDDGRWLIQQEQVGG